MQAGETPLNGSETIVSKGFGVIRDSARQESRFRPWLFRHQNLAHALEKAEIVNQEGLSNRINYSHFTEKPILVHLRHYKYEESILLRAYPDPCSGHELSCRWSSDRHPAILDLESYKFLHIMIDDGRSLLLAPIQLKDINGNSFTIQLPERSYAVGQRQARRYICSGVISELFQSGFFARGELLDFSPIAFRIRVRPDPSCSFHWFNPDELVSIHLRHDKQIFFSGTCTCVRQQGDFEDREIVLIPPAKEINRFTKRHMRSPRQHLVPSPTVVFNHPFLKKELQLEAHNISTSGCCVYEKAEDGMLMQGMIIPRLKINFAGVLEMMSTAQVIHRSEEKGEGVRCGLAILDMDIEAYSRLTHIMTNALDPHAYVSSTVDMEALWEFFFDSGFIYPMKYQLIQSHKESFKEIYTRLYQEKPEVARHFTYQKNGRIYGHISMVRAYERTWMIHHYAAKAIDSKGTGFMVLNQIMHYLNDMCRLPSAKMDYVMCYFRPQNKFPDRIFGGFARALNNPRGCSMDLFGYLPFTSLSMNVKLPKGWTLKECSTQDQWGLNRFYSYSSGGLLLNALDLWREASGHESLEKVYTRLGFLRKWRAYSLIHRSTLKAVLIVNRSDLGINLSELLNSVKVLVIDPKGLAWEVLSTAIAQLTSIYHKGRIPVLFYPSEYVKVNNIPIEKQYHLWILNARFGFEYLEYIQQKYKMLSIASP